MKLVIGCVVTVVCMLAAFAYGQLGVTVLPLSAAVVCDAGLAPCPPVVPYSVMVVVRDTSKQYVVRVEYRMRDGMALAKWGATGEAIGSSSTAVVLLTHDSRMLDEVRAVTVYSDGDPPAFERRIDNVVLGVDY